MKMLLILVSLISFEAMASHSWKKLDVATESNEMDEDGCSSDKLVLRANGAFTNSHCGKMRQGKLKVKELKAVNKLMLKVMSQFNKKLDCSLPGAQDYIWNFKVTSAEGKKKEIFSNYGDYSCERGSSLVSSKHPDGIYWELEELVLGYTSDK